LHSRKRAVSHRVGWLASGSPPYDGINSDRTRGTPMEKPVVAQKAPFAVTLSPGEYYWCACGRSKTQPMCDGSHQGTGLTPVTFALAETTMVYLCGCKQTKTPPHCDGTHKSF
jgi:CDGSH-type Zn-finger protein